MVRSLCILLLVAPTMAVSTAGGETPINRMCPVMPLEEVDPAITTVYKGETIGLCCERCLAKFNADPERYAARLAEFTSSNGPPAESDRTTRGHDDDDHAHDHASAEEAFGKLIGWLGKFHPPASNFPIAMLIGAALAEVLLITTRRVFFTHAVRFCLWVGAIGAVAAGVLGWFFGGFHFVDDLWILTTHRWLGTGTAVWALLALVMGERAVRVPHPRRTSFRLVLFSGSALVGVTGFFGGSMIYGIDHYAW